MTGVRRASRPESRHEHAARSHRGRQAKARAEGGEPPSSALITYRGKKVATTKRAIRRAGTELGLYLFATMPIPPCVVEVSRFSSIVFHDCPIGTADQEFTLGPKGDIRHCTADHRRLESTLGLRMRVELADGVRELVGWMRGEEPADRVERALSELTKRGLVV